MGNFEQSQATFRALETARQRYFDALQAVCEGKLENTDNLRDELIKNLSRCQAALNEN